MRGFVVQCIIEGAARVPFPVDLHKVFNSYTFTTGDLVPTIEDISYFEALIGVSLWNPCFQLLSSRYYWGNVLMTFPLTAVPTIVKFPVQAYGPNLVDTLPLSSTVRVNLYTAKRGRRFRGSKQIGPVSQDQVFFDRLAPAALREWNAATSGLGRTFLDVPASTNTFTLTPCIWSRENTGAGDGSGFGDLEQITSVEVNELVGRFRHRRPRTVVA